MTATQKDEQAPKIKPPLDWALEGLMTLVLGRADDRNSANLGLTLQVSGQVVAGSLVTPDAWAENVRQLFRSATGEGALWMDEAFGAFWEEVYGKTRVERQSAEGDGPALPFRTFIHMSEAVIHTGPHRQYVGPWRGRLSEVSGWSIGVPEGV
jgi:hypothetical protein